ncbi:metallophosphoesterase [Granulicella sp. dw_53]|uniref:STAND family AAA ATPase n=1 Tax=Granulicella sp. dw_53 TaxID=2719792 RepID=UPI001BD5147C|nr:metallophosphoesterase [Granulicella sp. dw_53]
MRLAVLQLSDIHFQPTKKFVMNRLTKVVEAITAADLDWDHMLVVFSGDIAFSGKKAEFDLAAAFASGLKAEIHRRKANCILKMVAVPGNHDCDFTNPDNVTREILLPVIRQNIKSLSGTEKPLEHLLSVQSEFEIFNSSLSDDQPQRKLSDRAVQVFKFFFGETAVRVTLLNTAIACQRHMNKAESDQGKLFIPIHLTRESNTSEDEVYSITVLHHPTNWLESNNSVETRHFLAATSDLVLLGHQHEEDAEAKETLKEEKYLQVRAAALQGEFGSESGFNLIVSDTEKSEEEIIQLIWLTDHYSVRERKVWLKANSQRALHRQFVLADQTRESLNDPGTGFTHPRKKKLRLEDIYVPPRLQDVFGSHNKNLGTYDDIDRAPEELLTELELTILIGEGRSGKTTLAKRAFLQLYEGKDGIVPIFLGGDEVNSSHLNIAKLWKLVEREFRSQYDDKSLAKFSQLDRSLRAVIVDKWQSSELNEVGRKELLEHLSRSFGRILLLTEATLKLDKAEIYTGSFADKGQFAAYRIAPFGHLLRASLIRKWLMIGREKTLSSETLHDEVHRAELILNTVLGRSLLPSFPFFLLSLLQIDQSTKTSNHANGSYGYLYDSLITMALAEVSQQATEVDVYYTVLGRFAWQLHRNSRTGLSATEFTAVLVQYGQEYKALFEASDIKNRLLRASILVYQDGEYSFRYKYIYYFFMARFLADQMKTPEYAAASRTSMLKIADNIENEENANIVIFLIYLTRDADLIAKLLSDARALFAGFPMFDAEAHVAFLAPAVQQMLTKEAVIVDATPEQNRDEERRARDREEHEDESQEQPERGPNTQFIRSIKSIDILGQIVRNFPGSMPGKLKVEITSEVYRLGLRVLGSIISRIEANEDEFRGFLRRAIRGSLRSVPEREFEDDAIDKRVDRVVVLYLDIIVVSLFKNITAAVGSSQLKPTYDEVKEGLGNTPAVNLIDLSIGLDHGLSFPKSQILTLNEDFQKKWFARILLRHLVANHFRMFHVDRSAALTVASKIGISMKSPQIIARLAAK